jgi:hypothetical protein
LKGINKNYSKQAPEAAGTSIAISPVNNASGHNQCEIGIAMTLTILLVGAANILLAGSTFAIVLWMWQDERQLAMTAF